MKGIKVSDYTETDYYANVLLRRRLRLGSTTKTQLSRMLRKRGLSVSAIDKMISAGCLKETKKLGSHPTISLPTKLENPSIHSAIGIDKFSSMQQVKDISELTVNYILKVVCAEYGVKISDVKGVVRKREFVEPRHVFCSIVKRYFGSHKSLSNIGKVISRDHSTIINSIKNVNDWLDTDKQFRKKYFKIVNFINTKFDIEI